MGAATPSFQVFVKPVGPICNMKCRYCYYLGKESRYPESTVFAMPRVLLEEYIVQHIEASEDEILRFSWHGGEPTLPGLHFFEQVIDIQRTHQPPGRRVANGLQTNGLLLDDRWGRFLGSHDFQVGLSIDGPQRFHDRYRRDRKGRPTFNQTLRGFEILKKNGVKTEILCVVNDTNGGDPLGVYRFFRDIGASYITFLPLVNRIDGDRVTPASVSPEKWGNFLVSVFNEWMERDIGRIQVQIFEETARCAFDLDHSLCIFRETCGEVPVVDFTGDFYACDHFVDDRHHWGNILESPLDTLLADPRQREFGRAKAVHLPRYCRECPVIKMCNGGCPRNRFTRTPAGETGLNYLCAGYREFFLHTLPFVKTLKTCWAGGQ